MECSRVSAIYCPMGFNVTYCLELGNAFINIIRSHSSSTSANMQFGHYRS